MKIVACNLGYLLGRHTAWGGYLPSVGGAIFGDRAAETRAVDRFVELVVDEQPDLIAITEVDRGSARTTTDGQLEVLAGLLTERKRSYAASAFNKYGSHRLVGNLPFYRYLSNGVLTSQAYPTQAHYLDHGFKRLVIEVEIEPLDCHVFIVHLSLRLTTRQRQLEELASLVNTQAAAKHTIVTGDFNIFTGMDELDTFLDASGLIVQNPGPSVQSRTLEDVLGLNQHLDLFVCSPGIRIDRCEVLDVQLSDHRPIVLDIDPAP